MATAREPDPAVRITVARTGGFAGLRREWSATATTDESDEWMPLIDACPWRAIADDPAARDRFVWVIDVKAPRRRRTARVPEAALTGPWRALVEKVTAASPNGG